MQSFAIAAQHSTCFPKGVHKCCVWGCRNNKYASRSDVSYYNFPTGNLYFPHRAQRRMVWLAAVRSARPEGLFWEPNSRSRICSEHFVDNKKSEDPRNPSYNPTIFPKIYNKIEENKEIIIEKHKRILERENFLRMKLLSTEGRKQCENKNITINISKTKNAIKTRKMKNARPKTIDKTTQADFIEESESSQNIFICCRYVGSDVSDAEIQTYRPKVDSCIKVERDPFETEKIFFKTELSNEED